MSSDGKRLLCVDLDETLLNTDKSISEENLEAIKELAKQGHFFAFASGRPVQSCLPIAEKYGFDLLEGFYIISYNGALIYDCKNRCTVYTKPLERSYLRLIFDEAAKAGIHCHTYDRFNVVSEHQTAMLEEYTRVIKMPPVIVDDVSTYLDVEPLKIICADLYDRLKLEAFRSRLEDRIKGHLESVFSNDRLLEYGAYGANKGTGILKLCNILNLDPGNSVSCGDQENDLAMIETAGVGCCVQNAVPALKEKADFITENDNNHGAVAEIIRKVIL